MFDDSLIPHLPAMVEADHMHCRLPSRPDWIEPAVEFLRQRALLCGACDEAQSGKIMMGLHEAISNAIVHGNLQVSSELKEQGDSVFAQELARRSADQNYSSRMVDVRFEYDGDESCWTITDEGDGFDVDAMLARDPASGEEVVLSSGRGILLMRAFFDRVEYLLAGRRVVLTFRKPKRKEPRRWPRRPTMQPIRIVPMQQDGRVDWQAAYDGLSRNFSRQGIGVLQAQLAAAQRVLIGLEADGRTLYVPASVRHCRQVSTDFVELGCQFQQGDRDPMTTEIDAKLALRAIGDLVDQLDDHRFPDDERRAHPRVAYTSPIQVSGGPEGEPAIGFGRDLSKGGMAFVTTASLPYDTRLLTLPSLSGPPVRIGARIVRCNRIMDGFYDIGVRFEA